MNGDIRLYGSGGGLDRNQRRAGQAISAREAQAQVRAAEIDIAANLSLEKIEVKTVVTTHGMVSVVQIAQRQTAYEQIAPQASGRLNMLAERHAFAVADELDDLERKLRRL